MALSYINNFLRHGLCNLRLDHHRTFLAKPRIRYPKWFVRKERVIHDDFITPENQSFIKEVVQDKYTPSVPIQNRKPSVLNASEEVKPAVWRPGTLRTGLICKKIGEYPLWSKDGKRILTTLLQVVDNEVIKFIKPGEWDPPRKTVKISNIRHKMGCLLVGAETVDPTLVTREYYGLFKDSGVMPKKHIRRFIISPWAAVPPGTPLFANHFRVGDMVDVRGKTIDRGFQGVMKRWGFKGMPASHGVTKTHRRPGNIGSGGQKARVWPGQKMPGHMGNRWRTLRGLKILRINTKHDVLWVTGVSIPGETNSYCYVYDTVLPLRRLKSAPPFPTYQPDQVEQEEIYDESVHPFDNPTISYPE